MSASMEEYATAAVAAGADGRPIDGKNRVMVTAMTDREISEETLATLRALADVLEAVGQSPMAAAMMPGLGKLSGR